MRGIRQIDIDKAGPGVRLFQKIESGRHNFTLKTLLKTAEALGTDVSELFHSESDVAALYKKVFFEVPFGIIIWRLMDRANPESLCLFEFNRYGAQAVHRRLETLRGCSILEIFPRAREQKIITWLYEVITGGGIRSVPEVIRHDVDFPFTVFSAHFVKCGADLGAAIFTDVTKDYLVKRKLEAAAEKEFLPSGYHHRIAALEAEVDALLGESGRQAKYASKESEG